MGPFGNTQVLNEARVLRTSPPDSRRSLLLGSWATVLESQPEVSAEFAHWLVPSSPSVPFQLCCLVLSGFHFSYGLCLEGTRQQ